MPYIETLVICKIQGSVEAILQGPEGDQVLKFLPACPQKNEVTCSHVVKYDGDDWNTNLATSYWDPLPQLGRKQALMTAKGQVTQPRTLDEEVALREKIAAN